MTTHIILPDPHAHPDHNNDRFSDIGEFVYKTRPDHLVCLGDWADLPSLSSYDRGTKGFEGKRYAKDLECAIDAQEKFFKPIKQMKTPPKMWMLIGNHEHRITRAVDANAAQLDGIISIDDLQYEDFGWEVINYDGSTPGILHLDGVAYAHYFTSGVMGRPISGEHPAYSLLTKQYQSCTAGHIHTADYAVRTNAEGRRIHALIAGCAIDQWCSWAGEANRLWRPCVVVKRDVDKGDYDLQFVSLSALKSSG